MKHNVIILTSCSRQDYDRELCFKKYFVEEAQQTQEVFAQMVMERGYELADEDFNEFSPDGDHRYCQSGDYTEYQCQFHIDENVVVFFDEHNGINTCHFYGDTHECWTKPEKANED